MLSLKPGLAMCLDAMPSASAEGDAGGAATKNPVVVLETSMGTIQIELDQQRAPISTRNFLDYVESRHYDGTVFHRVISSFMIQGGGMTPDMQQRKTRGPIRNEAGNGLKNVRGTLAMARTNVVDSATSQFFINVKDNDFLNHQNESAQGFGYAVFGKVVEGMDVVDKIRNVQTGTKAGHSDVPVEPVVIKSATVKKANGDGRSLEADVAPASGGEAMAETGSRERKPFDLDT